MEAISYTRLRANLAGVMEQVVDDHDAVIITRRSQPGVVMISLEDYESLQETAYLMRSPKNAKRLMESIEQLNTGKGHTHSLDEVRGLGDAD